MKRILGLCLFFFILCSAAGASAEEVFFYHVDAVGTPLAMTNATGQKVWEADYKPFGEEYAITTSSEPNDRRFVGKEKDEETGLNYFGARYLSAGTGRFLAADPVRAVDANTGKINSTILQNPHRVNLYAYSLNNPLRYVDPDGQIPLDTIWDLGNIIYDIASGDRGALAADMVAFAIPYVPAGASKLIKGVSRAGDVAGTATTPGGRTLTSHAFEQATNGAPGRRPMSMSEIDKVLDDGNKIRKIDMNHPSGPTVTVQNTNMPGMPRVVVDAGTGKRVITVIQPNSNKIKP